MVNNSNKWDLYFRNSRYRPEYATGFGLECRGQKPAG